MNVAASEPVLTRTASIQNAKEIPPVESVNRAAVDQNASKPVSQQSPESAKPVQEDNYSIKQPSTSQTTSKHNNKSFKSMSKNLGKTMSQRFLTLKDFKSSKGLRVEKFIYYEEKESISSIKHKLAKVTSKDVPKIILWNMGVMIPNTNWYYSDKTKVKDIEQHDNEPLIVINHLKIK